MRSCDTTNPPCPHVYNSTDAYKCKQKDRGGSRISSERLNLGKGKVAPVGTGQSPGGGSGGKAPGYCRVKQKCSFQIQTFVIFVLVIIHMYLKVIKSDSSKLSALKKYTKTFPFIYGGPGEDGPRGSRILRFCRVNIFICLNLDFCDIYSCDFTYK